MDEQTQIGKYVVGRKLGAGGFGDVFAAHDAGLERDVALKLLRAEHTASPEIVRRFLQEARSAARVVHPGIVTVYECAQLPDGTAYIAMELLDGDPLDVRLARGRLAIGEVMELGRQLASALDAAHRAGIVHRDLKPENVFVVADSAVYGGERAKILDFGIAKLGDAVSSSLQTQASIVFGTPRYMSPEQCRSAAAVDHRSDIYSLGCLLFELACGRPPFEGGAGELIAHHLLVAPPPVRELAPATPPALADLIERMLAKEPAERPQSMAEVQLALEVIGELASGVAVTSDTVIQMPAFPAAEPTTLSALAGSTTIPPRPAALGVARLAAAGAGVVGVVALVAVIAFFAFRTGDPLIAAGTPATRPDVVRTIEPMERTGGASVQSIASGASVQSIESGASVQSIAPLPPPPPIVTFAPVEPAKPPAARPASKPRAKPRPQAIAPVAPQPNRATVEPVPVPSKRDATINPFRRGGS